MESDYQDGKNISTATTKSDDAPDLNAFLQAIKLQIEIATDKMAGDFSHVIAANDAFKQEITNANDAFKVNVKQELDDLRQLICQHQLSASSTSASIHGISSQQAVSSPSTNQSAPILNPVGTSSVNTTTSVVSSSTTDQVLLLLTDSFAKMANALTEKSGDTKTEWPKFGGDEKKFKAWYLAILTQLSIAPWRELYDPTKNDVVIFTTNTTLNERLYSKLVLALEGAALQHVVSRKHLRANGLAVLQDLVQTYKPKNIPEVIAAKTSEFWGTLKRNPNESVDAYYNRFHDLLDDLAEADEAISTKSALRQFLFTLGPEFEPIQHNYRLNNLPEDWKTQDWPKFLALCRDYYNSVKPTLVEKKPSPSSDMHFDKEAHQKKIRDWFLNPTKFCKFIDNEQLRHPNKCIYHLSKTHTTDKCAVKLECDRIVAAKKKGASTPTPTNSTGQLRHITEEASSDSVVEDVSDADFDQLGNDTNEDALLYFERLSKHYLRLVKSSYSVLSDSRHTLQYPVIADSGANYHMFKEREFFDTLQPATGSVILGDGTTTVSIKGIGTVKCKVGSYQLTIPNVRYIPGLSESVYSLFQHIKTPNHGLKSTFDDGLYLNFPDFQTKAIIGSDDIYVDMLPIFRCKHTSFSSTDTPNFNSTNYCRAITHQVTTNDEDHTSDSNTLQDLRRYYAEVKTKRQLGLDVPAGYRSTSALSQQHILHTPPRKSAQELPTIQSSSSSSDQIIDHVSTLSTSHSESLNIDLLHTVDSGSDNNVHYHIPIIRSIDKPSSSLPQTISMSEDYIRSCVGFRRIDTLKRNLKTLYQPTVTLDNTPPDAILDSGYFATQKKKDRNTTPVPRPSKFGEVIHLDIVFGPEISIGNVHYGLLCVDRFSRMTYVYPLQNLTEDIQKQLESFFAHLGMVPKRIISDFDLKLVGGRARRYLNSLLVHVNAAPSYRQDKNGLAERHWQTLVSMARNWLASAELPSTFWFYAVRRAAEVCNYFPLTLENGETSTPFELAHQTKPDLRVLFKPFALAAVRRERHGDEKLEKFEPQSTPMIALGRCPTSNGIQFYNPANSTFVSSIDYTFQPHVTSGSRFGFRYQPGTFIYRLEESNAIFAPKFNLEANVWVHTHSPPHLATVIGIPSYTNPDIYTVKFQN